MSETGSYKSLIVWQKSILLVKNIYILTAKFPGEEKFGLVSQMRRAAVSIPSNIAEGQARRTTPDFIRFISMAEGSLAELDTQLTISVELGYCSQDQTNDCGSLKDEIRKMLNALRRTLLAKSQANQ
ncbi:MAG TPA: four helix bundle protein [Pyrinomonadaceae bacterium]|nr:four helix bundle protein [Pyrinomonadaceae bacterium]